jgi:hypothetical protein
MAPSVALLATACSYQVPRTWVAIGDTLLEVSGVKHIVASVLCCGCASEQDHAVELRFVADPGAVGSEHYVCFGFDASHLAGADVGGIALDAQSGPVTLHHVALYASSAAFGDGPVDCEAMPSDAVPLNVWATGGGNLELPADLALVIPAGTSRLIIQAHALRIDGGAAAQRSLVLTPRRDALHRAGWLPLRAPTPAIRPFHRETSTASCVVVSELHVVSTWPHMHRVGTEFHGRIVGASRADALVDVAPWMFDAQRAYGVDALVGASDAIETECIWQNDSERTILPGPGVDDEMCGQSLIAWPVEAARCE